jgi:putative peptidoglycan lipid II flippase
MFPMIVISAITGVGTGLLNANRVFWVATLIGVPQNIVIIITVVLLSKTQGIYSLAIGTLLGVGGQLLLVLPWMIRYGYRPRFLPDFKDVNMFKGLKMAGPVIIGSAVYYAGIVVDRIMASGLPDGSIAALNYAFKLNTFVVGIFISAVYLVSLQSLSVLVSKKDYAGFKDAVGENICLMGILIIPMVAGLFVLREQIITVLFKGGSFDEIAVQRTASALGFYSLGLVGISIRDILNSSFYALKDTKSPTINAVIAVILNIVLNLLLIKKIGHTGLALSTSISATVLSLLLFRKIRTKIGSIDEKRMLVTYGKCGAAAFIMGCFAHVIHIFLATLPLSPSLVLVVTIFFSALIYFFLVYIFGVDELVKFKLFLYAKIFKKFHLRGKRGAI